VGAIVSASWLEAEFATASCGALTKPSDMPVLDAVACAVIAIASASWLEAEFAGTASPGAVVCVQLSSTMSSVTL
jgi:hypothetical protein